MFPIFHYIKNTDLNKFRKDYADFSDLKRFCNLLKENVKNAELELICNANYCVKNDLPLKCIHTSQNEDFEINSPEHAQMCWYLGYCENFYIDVPCNKDACLYKKLNNKYVYLKQKYDHWTEIKNTFWEKKFMNSK